MKYKTYLILILLIFCSLRAAGEIRYVSKTGSSIQPYTSWTTASDSIQKCINISNFGDTIYVANGVYKEQIIMIPGLALIGSGTDSCIIDTREFQLTSPFYSVKVVDTCYIAFFQVITYDQQNGFGIRITGTGCLIEYNQIRMATVGIDVFTSGFNLIKKNLIFAVDSGIDCWFTNSIISDNIIYPKGYGLGSGLNSSPTYINNTIIMKNASNLSSGFSDGLDIISKLKNNLFVSLDNSGHYGIKSYADTLINNVVIGQWDYGIWTAGVTNYDAVIKNNTIVKTQTALKYYSDGTPPLFTYNNLWNNQTDFIDFSADTTNLYNDPMFVNEDSLDLHLQMYSPLIDAGDPTIPDKDGSRSDIGLFGGPYGQSYKYLDLAPRAPVNLTAVIDTNEIKLRWNKNTEADTFCYKIYRDTVPNFTIDSTRLIGSVTDTSFVQSIPHSVGKYIYKVTCVDNQSNESTPSEEIIVLTSIKEYPMTINDYMLYQNYPNPFNPSTKIGYRLKESGYVKLYVYDIKGELLSVLVNQIQEAGYYEVAFNASDGNSQSTAVNQLASGIYIYQIMVRNENNISVFSDLKKMIYLK